MHNTGHIERAYCLRIFIILPLHCSKEQQVWTFLPFCQCYFLILIILTTNSFLYKGGITGLVTEWRKLWCQWFFLVHPQIVILPSISWLHVSLTGFPNTGWVSPHSPANLPNGGSCQAGHISFHLTSHYGKMDLKRTETEAWGRPSWTQIQLKGILNCG